MLCVDRVSVDLNLTSRVSSGHSGFLPPQNWLLVKFVMQDPIDNSTVYWRVILDKYSDYYEEANASSVSPSLERVALEISTSNRILFTV